MKMQKLTIKFVSFDSDDVISTSGPTIYTFNGLGIDREGLSITTGGEDVTTNYIYAGSAYGIKPTSGSMPGYSLDPGHSAYVEKVDSTTLANNGIADGNYVLDAENGGTDDKFVPYSGN